MFHIWVEKTLLNYSLILVLRANLVDTNKTMYQSFGEMSAGMLLKLTS